MLFIIKVRICLLNSLQLERLQSFMITIWLGRERVCENYIPYRFNLYEFSHQCKFTSSDCDPVLPSYLTITLARASDRVSSTSEQLC